MITFAAAIFGIAGAAGLALDVSRVHNAKAEARDAADTAALAAVVQYNETQNKIGSETYGRDMFDSNYAPEINGARLASLSVNLDTGTGRATARARVAVPTTLMALFGQKSMVANVELVAVVNPGSKPFEVGVMLDVSGSMAGSKFEGLERRGFGHGVRTAGCRRIDAYCVGAVFVLGQCRIPRLQPGRARQHQQLRRRPHRQRTLLRSRAVR